MLFARPTTPEETRYVELLDVGDPVADVLARAVLAGEVSNADVSAALDPERGAPHDHPALLAFLEAVFDRPEWFSSEAMTKGCEAFQRHGVIAGIALALYSLPLGYLSYVGVKPLVLSGRLVERAPRRLGETNRFLFEVCTPGGLEPGAPGATIIAKVRLMHAIMRESLTSSGDWDPAWKLPINQAHMAGTRLLFSLHALDGLERLGATFSDEERAGYLHLWDAVGHILGVADELRTPEVERARELWATIRRIEGPTGEEGRALTAALIESAVPRVLGALFPFSLDGPRSVAQLRDLSSWLLGPDYATQLGLEPREAPRATIALLRSMVSSAGLVQSSIPTSRELAVALGTRLNASLAARALGHEPADFFVHEPS